MKGKSRLRYGLLLLGMFFFLPCAAQQIIYSNLKELIQGGGDTVTTLRVEHRAKNQIYLTGGADYRITADGNSGLSRYLKRRCYAVRVDTALYVNCHKMYYQRYRFGYWYASALQVQDKIYFVAQPLGQAASQNVISADDAKLGGKVGDAIHASGLVSERVYYELDPETGQSEFVGKTKMKSLLKKYPELLEQLSLETSESAEVMGKYLYALRRFTSDK